MLTALCWATSLKRVCVSRLKDSIKEEIESILIVSSIDQEEAEEALVHALVLGETAKDARRLVNLPPSHLYPGDFR